MNAVDHDRREGEDVAYRLFTWKTGTFEFHPEAPNPVRTIECGTEALMLEAARRMDETAGVGEPGAGEAVRLNEHRDSLEALRDAFQTLARETRATQPGHPIADALHARSVEPRDRLLYRPGKAVRLLVGGRWLPAEGAKLDALDYEALKARMLQSAAGAVSEEPPLSWRIHQDGGRRFGVQRVGSGEHEALWVRPLGGEAPDPSSLIGPPDLIPFLLGLGEARVAVGSTLAVQADHLLNALVRLFAEGRRETVVLVSDHPAYDHVDGAGVVLQVGPHEAEAAIRSLSPGVVAFECSVPLDERAFAALEAVPVVLTAMAAASLEALSARGEVLNAALGRSERECCSLFTPEGAQGEGGIGVQAKVMGRRAETDDAERRAA